MLFETEKITNVGGREHNEDACAFVQIDNTGCWAVADGLGGHRGGATASQIAVDTVLTSFRSNPEFSLSALRQHLEAAQQAVLKAQKEQTSLSGMRTTVVVLLADSARALWAHLGDSRLYRLDGGRMVFRTKDHSVVQARVNAGELSPQDSRHDKDRNRLLRSLGNKGGDFRPETVAEGQPLYKGTAFLLCSDGFWENVDDGEMEVDFAKAATAGEWLAKMEARLLERTTDGSDNYTAMAVLFCSEAAALPPPSPANSLNACRKRPFPGPKVVEVILGLLFVLGLGVSALMGWQFSKLDRERVKATDELKKLRIVNQNNEELNKQWTEMKKILDSLTTKVKPQNSKQMAKTKGQEPDPSKKAGIEKKKKKK